MVELNLRVPRETAGELRRLIALAIEEATPGSSLHRDFTDLAGQIDLDLGGTGMRGAA